MSTIKPNDIQRATAAYFKISFEEMLSKSRSPLVVNARHVAWFLERKRGLSYPAIGKLYGFRDHTTILAALNHMRERTAAQDMRYVPAITAIEQALERNEKKKLQQQEAREIRQQEGLLQQPIETVVLMCPTCGTGIESLRIQLEVMQLQLNKLLQEKT